MRSQSNNNYLRLQQNGPRFKKIKGDNVSDL